MRKQRVVLEHHGGTARRRRCVADGPVADHDVALTHRLMTSDHSQGRCLAAAGRTQQTAIGACLDFERDPIDRYGLAIALDHGGEFQIGRAAHVGPPEVTHERWQVACQSRPWFFRARRSRLLDDGEDRADRRGQARQKAHSATHRPQSSVATDNSKNGVLAGERAACTILEQRDW